MPRTLPPWLKVRLPNVNSYRSMKSLITEASTNTVCEEARCPNIGECWNHGTATFMILGDTCTRACRYCHVKTGWPDGKIDNNEPTKVAKTVKKLGLKYVVITSVDRDDLEDGGSSIFAETVRQIHSITNASVEVLTPDYTGENLKNIIQSEPEVFGHNIEAVRRIFKNVRSKGDYDKSLSILKEAKKINSEQKTKSALMVGFGETDEEVIETMKDLRDNDVDFLAIGQYLRPGKKYVSVEKYYKPEEFDKFSRIGKELGFSHIESGPLVRSSYRADKINNLIEIKG